MAAIEEKGETATPSNGDSNTTTSGTVVATANSPAELVDASSSSSSSSTVDPAPPPSASSSLSSQSASSSSSSNDGELKVPAPIRVSGSSTPTSRSAQSSPERRGLSAASSAAKAAVANSIQTLQQWTETASKQFDTSIHSLQTNLQQSLSTATKQLPTLLASASSALSFSLTAAVPQRRDIPVRTPYGDGILADCDTNLPLDEEQRIPVLRDDGIIPVHLGFGVAYLQKKYVFRLAKLPPKPGETWAPRDIPLSRRRQTAAVLLWYWLVPICIFFSFLCVRSNGLLLYAFLAYLCYLFFFQNFQKRGGFKSGWYRRLKWWKWFRDYFPIYLHKTVDIPATKPYIFGYHPHGIIGFGAQINFATEATGFSEKFPGINLHLLTLDTNFKIPFVAFHLGLLGVCDASKESIRYILKKGLGNSVMLVLGGAKESLDARPGQYDLTLKNRKGFVKLALELGADLVPVFGFGEVDVFDQVDNPRGSTLRKIQGAVQSKLGFATPLVKGRGIFSYGLGILPQRQPIHAVVGAPVHIPKIERDKITEQMIDEYHRNYMTALQDLFYSWKDFYSYRAARLDFVE